MDRIKLTLEGNALEVASYNEKDPHGRVDSPREFTQEERKRLWAIDGVQADDDLDTPWSVNLIVGPDSNQHVIGEINQIYGRGLVDQPA